MKPMCVHYNQNLHEILERSEDRKGGGEGSKGSPMCVHYKENLQEILQRSEDNKGGGRRVLCIMRVLRCRNM